MRIESWDLCEALAKVHADLVERARCISLLIYDVVRRLHWTAVYWRDHSR